MTSGETAAPRSGSDRKLRQKQVELLSLAEGFFDSQILLALNKLGVFEILGTEEKPLEEIAQALGAKPETIVRLLYAGVGVKLLVSKDGRTFGVEPRWQPVLLEGAGEGYLGDWLKLLKYLAWTFQDLDKAALNGGPVIDLLASKGQQDIHDFTMAMHSYAAVRGKEIVRWLDTAGCRTLLDLGCGPGTYAFLLGQHNPELALYLLDLPDILAVTREVQDRYPLENSITYLPLDVTKEDIPGRYDIVMVSNTLHMLGEAESRKLLKRLYETVAPGGSLVVQFQYLNDDRMGDRWPVILDLVQLCITENGRNHTVSETRQWMEDAGYQDVEFSAMSLLNTNGYLRGYRPKTG